MSIYEARTPQYIFCFLINLLTTYHSTLPGLLRLHRNLRGEDTLHSPNNPNKPPDEVASAHEGQKALYRPTYKPQTDSKTVDLVLYKTNVHLSCG